MRLKNLFIPWVVVSTPGHLYLLVKTEGAKSENTPDPLLPQHKSPTPPLSQWVYEEPKKLIKSLLA